MFVAQWELENIPDKPDLTSAHIWIKLLSVPFQLFNEDGLERITCLPGTLTISTHQQQINKTYLEVVKVLALISLRKQFLEAVSIQFESRDISKVVVSNP